VLNKPLLEEFIQKEDKISEYLLKTQESPKKDLEEMKNSL